MITSITLADLEGNDTLLHGTPYTRACVNAQGILGSGVPRDNRRVRPSADGAIDQTRYRDGILLPFEFEVTAASIEQAIAEFRLMRRPMDETLLAEHGALLKWTEGETGKQLQRLVKLASDVDPVLSGHAALVAFQAQFFAEDGRAYSQTLETFTSIPVSDAAGGMTMPFTFPIVFSPSGGGTVDVTNSGVAPSAPRFRVHGGCSNPQIVNLDSGDRIVLTGEVAPGDFWELDRSTGSIVAGSDGLSRQQFEDPANTTWFDIPAATAANPETHLQMLAEEYDGDAYLEVLLRAAY